MHRSVIGSFFIACALLLAGCASSTPAPSTVYVHMNGGNHFLEPIVAVAPGDTVTFVNQDTGGEHTIVGFNAQTGQLNPAINGVVKAASANGSTAPTYSVQFQKVGVYNYYCSVHSILVKTFGTRVSPAYRAGVDGFKEAMAGVIVVTTDRALIQANPASTSEKTVPGYFGG